MNDCAQKRAIFGVTNRSLTVAARIGGAQSRPVVYSAAILWFAELSQAWHEKYHRKTVGCEVVALVVRDFTG